MDDIWLQSEREKENITEQILRLGCAYILGAISEGGIMPAINVLMEYPLITAEKALDIAFERSSQ